MPRYYFHVYNDEVTLDEQGQELPDAEGARKKAIAEVRNLMCETVRKGQVTLSHYILVTDDADLELKVTFGDAVDIEP